MQKFTKLLNRTNVKSGRYTHNFKLKYSTPQREEFHQNTPDEYN